MDVINSQDFELLARPAYSGDHLYIYEAAPVRVKEDVVIGRLVEHRRPEYDVIFLMNLDEYVSGSIIQEEIEVVPTVGHVYTGGDNPISIFPTMTVRSDDFRLTGGGYIGGDIGHPPLDEWTVILSNVEYGTGSEGDESVLLKGAKTEDGEVELSWRSLGIQALLILKVWEGEDLVEELEFPYVDGSYAIVKDQEKTAVYFGASVLWESSQSFGSAPLLETTPWLFADSSKVPVAFESFALYGRALSHDEVLDMLPKAPCGSSSAAGTNNPVENLHYIGLDEGWVHLAFFGGNQIPDALEVLYDGDIIMTTGGPETGHKIFSWYYPAETGKPSYVIVRITPSPDPGTIWRYTLNCPTSDPNPPPGFQA